MSDKREFTGTEKVVLAWASRKRHIFINGTLLCEKSLKHQIAIPEKAGIISLTALKCQTSQ